MIQASFKLLRTNFLLLCATIVLYIGWMHRSDNYLSAETGTGYALGIIGGSLMLTLLLYPLSKRITLLTRLIPIRYWFGMHMLLGIVGPILVLFHSNFHLGSANSSIALICMLMVAGSGVIGRYIYTHIHHGLYGTRITLKELRQETENKHSAILTLYEKDSKLASQLKNMEDKAMQPYTNIISSLLQVMYLAINAPWMKRKILQSLKNSYSENTDETYIADKKIVVCTVKKYLLTLRKAAALSVYERLFSLWHILHLPLFIMMIITAVIHIFAVHLY